MATIFNGAAFAAGSLTGVYKDKVQEREVIVFTNSGTRQAIWTGPVVPQGFSGTPSGIVQYFTSVTTGSFTWTFEVEALAEGDTVDMDAGTSFDTANSAADTVPGTAGYPAQHSITLTTNDSMAAGDMVRYRLARTDGTTGTAYVTGIEIRDTA